MVRILKEYETKINISPTDLFAGTFSDNAFLLEYLRAKFEGKCMDSTFVLSIRQILMRSMMTIDKSDLAGGGHLHVRFSAEAIVHVAKSVLVGCEVMAVEREGNIMCKHEHAIVHIKGNKNFSPNVGEKIIARVIKIGYPVDSKSMSVGAIPYYIPHTFHITIVKPNPIGAAEKELLHRKLAELDNIKKLYASADQTSILFFEDLFYPYSIKLFDMKRSNLVLRTNHVSWDIAQLAEAAIQDTTVSKLQMGESIALSRHSAIPKQSAHVLVLKIDEVRAIKDDQTDPFNDKTKFEMKVVAGNYTATLLELLDDYCEYLSVLVECANTYSTDKIRRAHQRLWAVYNLTKS